MVQLFSCTIINYHLKNYPLNYATFSMLILLVLNFR